MKGESTKRDLWLVLRIRIRNRVKSRIRILNTVKAGYASKCKAGSGSASNEKSNPDLLKKASGSASTWCGSATLLVAFVWAVETSNELGNDIGTTYRKQWSGQNTSVCKKKWRFMMRFDTTQRLNQEPRRWIFNMRIEEMIFDLVFLAGSIEMKSDGTKKRKKSKSTEFR